MTAYKISATATTPSGSILPSVLTNVGDAFASGSAGADSLTVDVGAFLISTDPNPGLGFGALLDNTGAWTVTVNGSVFGYDGVFLDSGNLATSSITVGLEGSVAGTNEGITAGSSVTI